MELIKMITPEIIFNTLIAILVLSFFFNQWINWLDTTNEPIKLPQEIADIYDEEKYLKSKKYDKVKTKFSFISSAFSLLLMLGMLFFDGFAFTDELSRSITNHPVLLSLVFFAILMVVSDIVSLPFSLYSIFVIEEKFGFNKTTIKTFILDKIKGALVATILGGVVLYLFVWFYSFTGHLFWLWSWFLFVVIMLLMTMFYASIFVPLFNKLTPLPEGELRTEIEQYCDKVGFKLDNLFVMDGSKRSTKANAFFSGLGAKKRIVLYDTLVDNYSKEEITAVLAHEVGHYKKKHTLTTLFLSAFQVGIMLYLLSLVINSSQISLALGIDTPSFHIGFLVFSILYTPLSMLTGILMNVVSRKNEYEADNFAKTTYNHLPLISSLKKLSGDSLSNLTPHQINVFINYSHPTLLQRIRSLNK
ncbi:M48 family metallopeptidase [Vicingus serpentipes]|uniref:M48 family metallopeptidase n=1 Tax=Vicingus serpentipes TaxID=1926625 RepID=UPI001CB8B74C|nr:M48 family metallopeptidase [Vicingus serpentipes]